MLPAEAGASLVKKNSAPVKREPKPPKEPAPTSAAFEAYRKAIKARYGEDIEPPRGAAVNGQLAQMLKTVPAADLPKVLVYYVLKCNDRASMQARHAIRDAFWRIQTLYVDWQKGNSVTTSQANRLDLSATNYNALQSVLADIDAKEREKNEKTC
jgi:hypothetical protein